MTDLHFPAIDGVDGAYPVVQLGVGGMYDPIGGGQWNIATWNGPTSTWWGGHPSWVDISCFTLDIETFIGRDRASDTFEVGTATVTVDNRTGWADSPVSVPSDPDPALAVIPGREVRIGVRFEPNFLAPPIFFWRGVIDITTPGYSPEEGETVVLECIDAKGDAGRAELGEVLVAVGQDELPHVRMKRILDAAKWPDWRRDLSVASGVLLNATKLGKRTAELLDDVADSSGGIVFGDSAGRVAFRPRDWAVATSQPDPDAIISNGSGDTIQMVPLIEDPVGTGLYAMDPNDWDEDPDGSWLFKSIDSELEPIEIPPGSGLYAYAEVTRAICPSEWTISYARADFPNRVLMGREGEEPKIFELPEGPGVPGSARSQSLLGLETYSRTSVDTKLDSDMAAIALTILRTRAHHLAPRIAGVLIDAASDDDAPYVLANANPFKPSRFNCQHYAENGRLVFGRMMMLTGVTHTISPAGWTAELALDDARPFDALTAGRWNSAHWGQNVWSNF